MTESPHQSHHSLSQFDHPELPSQTHELFHLFTKNSSHCIRICALAKIKQQLISSVHDLISKPPSSETSQAVEVLISRQVLNFISKTSKYADELSSRVRSQEKAAQCKLFYHVVGLSVKFYFREEAIKGLMAEVTQLLEGHPERVKPALFLFTEIICTVENQTSDLPSNTTTHRCLFERHLFNEHINSMLTLGNYCIQRGILQDGLTLQDAPTEDLFRMLAPEETLTAALRLTRVCLCFDWQGDKNQIYQEQDDIRLLLIPIKRGRFSGQSQFEKWLKNTDWINLYQFLFREAQSKQLKIEAIEIIGDLSRAHPKFFKSKPNYRMYIEGIVHAFILILDTLAIYRSSQQTIEIALVLGINLNKLLNSATRAVLFEINANLIKALLSNIKNFIIQQIIGEEINNSNIIYFYFKFMEGVLQRSRFEKNKTAFDIVDQHLRQICRSYEHYLRILFNGIRRAPIRYSQSFEYRKDFSKLKDAITGYDWKQMKLYFMPFKLMRPRYFSTNTIYQLFIYLCARVTRAVSLLQMFKMEPWEIQVAYQMIIQAVSKIRQRFGLTSFKKPRVKQQLQNDSQSGQLPSIDEQCGQQIQNQEEYCHMLRLCLFLIMEDFIDKAPTFLLKISSPMTHAIHLTIELCFCADLQDNENSELNKFYLRSKIYEGLSLCPLLLKNILQRQYDRIWLGLSQNDNFKTNPTRYRSSYLYSDLSYIDYDLQNENINLLELLAKVFPSVDQQMKGIIVQMVTLLTFVLPQQFSETDCILLGSIDNCLVSVETIASMDIIIQLVRCHHNRLIGYLERVLHWIQTRACEKNDVLPTIKILRKIAQMKADVISQEALNKLFVALKFLLPSLREYLPQDEQLVIELEKIVQGILSTSRQADFDHLSQEIKHLIVNDSKKAEPMDLQETCLNISLNDQPVPSVYIEPQISQNHDQNVSKIKQNNYQEKLYAGYHMDQTMSLIEKYKPPEENTENQQPQKQIEDNPQITHDNIDLGPAVEEVQEKSNNDQNSILNEESQPLLELQKIESGSPDHPSTPHKLSQERSQSSQSNRQLLLKSSSSQGSEKKAPQSQT